MPSKDDYMTAEEICELFHITRNSLYRWGARGKLRAVAKIGNRNFYLKSDVYALLDPKAANDGEGE